MPNWMCQERSVRYGKPVGLIHGGDLPGWGLAGMSGSRGPASKMGFGEVPFGTRQAPEAGCGEGE